MVLFGWQHTSQCQTQGLLLLLLLLLQLLLSVLVAQSELLLEDVEADAATLCEHLRLVLREDDAANLREDLRLVLREDDAATLVLRE